VLLIMQREIVMRLRSRVFRVGTVLIVALMVVGALVASLVAGRSMTTRVGFVGSTDALAQPFSAMAASLGLHVTVVAVDGQANGESDIRNGRLDVLVDGSLTDPEAVIQEEVDPTIFAALQAVVRQAALESQLSEAGLDPKTVEARIAAAGVTVRSLTPVDPQRTPEILVGFVVAYTLMMSLSFYGAYVAQGVVEEKSTRIVEIVLSTVRPSQLLTGKIVGIGLVGLLQLVIIATAGFILVATTHIVSIPSAGAGALVVDLAWFALGFYFYATLFAAGVTAPPVLLLIMAYILVYAVVPDPSSLASTVLSMLPPFAPVLMTFRTATSDVPIWQVLLAMALSVATSLAITGVAARIYANSILRVGSRVRLIEALRGR
jgi:ABC-2 type transport system permease protein